MYYLVKKTYNSREQLVDHVILGGAYTTAQITNRFNHLTWVPYNDLDTNLDYTARQEVNGYVYIYEIWYLEQIGD